MDPSSRRGAAVCRREPVRRIDTRELIRRQRCDRSRRIRRPLECRVVMNDHNPVARQPDVELETIGPERETVIERRNRILGPKRAPPRCA
jgi:hypothetical protein